MKVIDDFGEKASADFLMAEEENYADELKKKKKRVEEA